MRDEPTSKEKRILELIGQGYGNKRIAIELGMSPHTVTSHLCRVYRRLGVYNRTSAVVAAHRAGYINIR